MTVSKGEDTGNWKRKHQIALYGDLAFEDTVGLSLDRQQDELMNEVLDLKM